MGALAFMMQGYRRVGRSQERTRTRESNREEEKGRGAHPAQKTPPSPLWRSHTVEHKGRFCKYYILNLHIIKDLTLQYVLK